MSKTYYSLFTGCGGACTGAKQAGYTPLGGIEYHQPAADIYNSNHANPVTVADILDIDRLPSVDLLWISPPCPSFSIANTQRGETDRDITLAAHIAQLAIESKPRSIAIENVRGYAKSRSLKLIVDRLSDSGYSIDMSIECAANYGAPTTRERLIVRASLNSILPLLHTHRPPSNQLSIFPLPSWMSWWKAIENRIGELPKSKLTSNQIAVLQKQNRSLPLSIDSVINYKVRDYTIRESHQPINTITATIAKHPIRILVERVGYYNSKPNTYHADIPAPTIRAHTSIDGYRGSYRVSHNIIDNCNVYAADVKCLAAWQGFPSDYQWTDNKGEAARSIGNAVPPPLAKAIARSFSH